MKKRILVAVATMVMGFTSLSVAEEVTAAPAAGTNTTVGAGTGTARTPAVRRRARRQKARVIQGVKSGELTKNEVKDLRQDGKAIRQEVKDAKSDGVVTKEERKQIHKDLNKSSKKIYEYKHNDEKQPAAQ